MTPLTTDPYPEICQILAGSVSVSWRRLELELQLLDDWADFRLRVVRRWWQSARYVPVGDPGRLHALLFEVRRVAMLRNSQDGPEWTRARFVLHRAGTFKLNVIE